MAKTTVSVKLREIIDIEAMIMEVTEMKFPQKISYKLSKIAASCKKHIKDFSEWRMDLIIEHSEETPEGGIKIKPESKKIFEETLKNKLDEEVLFENIFLIDDLSSVELKPSHLVALEMFMDESLKRKLEE